MFEKFIKWLLKLIWKIILIAIWWPLSLVEIILQLLVKWLKEQINK